MARDHIISVISPDKVGIIANISKTIELLGGNLGDLSQNVLDGYFSMTLLSSFPDKLEPNHIEKELIGNFKTLSNDSFSIKVWPSLCLKQNPEINASDEKYILTACIKDKKGLVAAISSFCSEHNLNILSLDTEIRDGLYNMIFMLDAHDSSPIKEIRSKLKELETKLDSKLIFQHYRIFKATNEIKL